MTACESESHKGISQRMLQDLKTRRISNYESRDGIKGAEVSCLPILESKNKEELRRE